jgi:uncharacterized alkaline shock family protein YloU
MAETKEMTKNDRGSAPMRASQRSELGTTSIADVVVSKIAAIAAREIAGVHELVPGNVAASVSGLAQRVIGGDSRARGVSVEVGQREAAIDLYVRVDYGVNIAQVADAIRQAIIGRIEAMTGLVVKEVNVNVIDLYFADDDQEAEDAAQRARRVE